MQLLFDSPCRPFATLLCKERNRKKIKFLNPPYAQRREGWSSEAATGEVNARDIRTIHSSYYIDAMHLRQCNCCLTHPADPSRPYFARTEKEKKENFSTSLRPPEGGKGP